MRAAKAKALRLQDEALRAATSGEWMIGVIPCVECGRWPQRGGFLYLTKKVGQSFYPVAAFCSMDCKEEWQGKGLAS